MATNASANINADVDGTANNESSQNDENAATTPIRKEIVRSPSLMALDEARMGCEVSTPLQASTYLATPVVSNIRKKPNKTKHEDLTIANENGHKSSIDSLYSSDDKFNLEPRLLKSVSFENHNRNAKEDTILGESYNTADDAYGYYLNTSNFEGSPDRQLNQSATNGNVYTDTTYVNDTWMEKLKGEMYQKHDSVSALSIPELSNEKPKISFPSVTLPGHRRHISLMSELSSGSDDDNDDETISATPRDDSHRIMQVHSNRRVSLTIDMETGRSPTGPSLQFHRGQRAMRRVMSTDMMDAQSPRVRRRRALSHNIDQMRRGFLNNVEQLKGKKISLSERNHDSDGHPIGDPEGIFIPREEFEQQHQQQSIPDSSRDESVQFTDRKRRDRYNVEQKNVEVPNDKKTRNYHDGVQYRLSAITPIELRRRRYRNIISGNAGIGEGIDESSNNKTGDGNHGGIYTDGKCKQCLISVGNFLTELTIFLMSKGKQNYSVGLVNRFLYWTFRKNFFVVLMSAACSFYLFTVSFAILIYLLGKIYPKCIHVNGVDFGETKTRFIDAFALSWTTFSTVGYGLVYPATSATISEDFDAKKCTGIAIITTMEAFVGILFSGVWGAICFAKLTRVSSFAQVSFSDPIIVKYGTGVTGVVADDEYGSSDDDELHESENFYKQSKLPCPIFEFRIVNRLYRQRGGEIIDAAINIVASMEESQATRSIRNGAGMEPKIRRKGRRPKRIPIKNIARFQDHYYRDVRSQEEIMKEANIKQAQEAARAMIVSYTSDAAKAEIIPSIISSLRLGGVSEDENEEQQDYRSSMDDTKSSKRNNKPFPNQIFAKLNVESQEHPFFKRVWNVRHVLDVTSPLVKQEAKELIRINKGHWPEELNNATAVRASIHFDQILVSFSGTSNVDANSVYSQKAYNLGDVGVGYAFCNMLFRESDGSIGVDYNLLNDVKEQSGGGGEELYLRGQETSNRILPDIFIL